MMSPSRTPVVFCMVLAIGSHFFHSAWSFSVLKSTASRQHNANSYSEHIGSISLHAESPLSSSSAFSSSPDNNPEEQSWTAERSAEFMNLEPIEESETRRQRKDQDERNREQFAKYGNDLWDLRKTMEKLSVKLVDAINGNMGAVEQEIRQQLRQAESRDPELIYKVELELMITAQREGRTKDAEQHSRRASAARSCLPQFNLEGLWLGKYGQHGYEMINITYSGDHLVAYKVTGDKNVPKGELTFQADLNPLKPTSVAQGGGIAYNDGDAELQPISLTDKAAKKWGTTQLPRYKGLGQVAEPGFTNNQWMEGQLIIIGDDYFSFAWVPIESQIFFGRPSPELALKMLREAQGNISTKEWKEPPSVNDDVQVLKDYVASCLQRTHEAHDEADLSGDTFSCIWHGMDTEECYFE